MENLENDISVTIQDIHNRIKGTDWLQIEVITEYSEMLGGKVGLLSVDLKYSCALDDKEKTALENSKNKIAGCLYFDGQDELINYVANYYAVSKGNIKIVGTEIAKDHFD